ncbi:MAG: YbaN family protein [Pseudomonadota bacterium]
MRVLWVLCGIVSLALGALGVVLPLVPTVPFLLLTAFCFARSSPRLHVWLIEHPVFGPPIRNWQDRGAISRRAKRMATLSVAAVFLLSLLLGVRSQILALQAIILTGVLVFIWSRPED